MPHFFEKWGIFLFLIHDLLNSREFDEFMANASPMLN